MPANDANETAQTPTMSKDATLLIAALHGPAPSFWWNYATAPDGPISKAGITGRAKLADR